MKYIIIVQPIAETHFKRIEKSGDKVLRLDKDLNLNGSNFFKYQDKN